ncbi:MAG: hypothetical protein H7101_01550 [Deinococcales bacterium]|nr:hypothetical protein [Chitinophagaceae bacterium]
MQKPIKTCMLLLILAITLTQCKKSTANQIDLLPPITTNGANTFGCLVNGTAMLPKSGIPTFNNPFPNSALRITFGSEVKIETGNYDGPANYMCFYMYNLYSSGISQYNWKSTLFGTESFPVYNSQLYGTFYNSNTNSTGWYGSYDSSGTVAITKFDTSTHVISGVFTGKLRRENSTEEISITNGRFDINWTTVANKKFQ